MSALPTCCPSPSLTCVLQAAAPGAHTPLTFHRTSVSTEVLHTHQHALLASQEHICCRCPHCRHFASQMDLPAKAFSGQHLKRIAPSPSAAPHPSQGPVHIHQHPTSSPPPHTRSLQVPTLPPLCPSNGPSCPCFQRATPEAHRTRQRDLLQ